jgi:cell division protein FtsN
MRPNITAVSFLLLLMAASSLVSMISTLKIDHIVHGDLYNYGLQFSYQWAMPYWTMTAIVFAMGWFNIIIAIAFQFYVLIYGRKEVLKPEATKEPQLQPTREEIIKVETKPAEKVEESREQATEPAEKVEKKPEENQPLVEATPQSEQTETIQTEEAEGQKGQESKPAEESKIETKETSTTATETEQKQQTSEKSEETPIFVGVPEETPQTATEDTPQQV